MPIKQNIFIIGPMGAGKTTIGKSLAKALQLDFYDTDREIEARAGADLAWILDIEGEAGFHAREHKVLDELSQHSSIVLSTGGGIIELAENRAILAARGIVIFLQTTIEAQLKRTEKDRRRPLLQTDKPREVLERLREERESFYEELADLTFRTDNNSVRSVVSDIIKSLKDIGQLS